MALFVHWVNGVERVIAILHHGSKLYLRVTRERREIGCPLDVVLKGPDAFMVHQDPSTPHLYHIRHKGQTLTLWIGYPPPKVKRFDWDAVQVRFESGPQWVFRIVEPLDDDWPNWDDYRKQPQSKESGGD